LIIGRSEKGEALIRSATNAKSIALEDVPLDSLTGIQPYQTARKHFALARWAAVRIAGRPSPRYSFRSMLSLAILAPKKAFVKNFGGTLMRVTSKNG